LPDSESNQFRYARRASLHACTKATDGAWASHSRSAESLAKVITRRCTSLSLIFSPAAPADRIPADDARPGAGELPHRRIRAQDPAAASDPHPPRAPVIPAHLAASWAGAPLPISKQHAEQQPTPGS
jgi:hypothetical protein